VATKPTSVSFSASLSGMFAFMGAGHSEGLVRLVRVGKMVVGLNNEPKLVEVECDKPQDAKEREAMLVN
jgi:hypothetical protein